MHEDGTMGRVGDLGEYQEKHGLNPARSPNSLNIDDAPKDLITREEIISMPTEFGDFDCYLYQINTDESEHLALVRGEIDSDKPISVRVHSECLTGDVFGSRRCDCGGTAPHCPWSYC
jgi:3,4-dihydroxy 2-butanone 4-phosphate synthase/GTP cyclohydrolase II